MVFNSKEPSTPTAEEWFTQEELSAVIVIQGRLRLSLFVWNLRTWSVNITSLNLQLDRNHAHSSDNHLHHLYFDNFDKEGHEVENLPNAEVEQEDFPNAAVEQDVVRLCHALSGTLAHLSISMCKPELMVGSYVPRIMYDILLKCPELQSLSLKDVQCAEFGEEYRPTVSTPLMDVYAVAHRLQATEMLYMEAIAMGDQQEMWSFPIQPKLQTLGISKRSAAGWVENFACLNRVPAQVSFSYAAPVVECRV